VCGVAVLYHYTCEHGRAALGEAGTLLPPGQFQPGHASRLPEYMRETSWFIWCTDLDFPFRAALGLSRVALVCDRTRYRYRVAGDISGVARWTELRETCHPRMVAELESAHGAMPMHWWVACTPLRAHYAPIQWTAA
jgi:hypothetical protein